MIHGDYVDGNTPCVGIQTAGSGASPGYGHQVFEDGSVAGQVRRMARHSPIHAVVPAERREFIGRTTSHVRHTARTGRRAGYTVGVTETGQTGAWTTAQDGAPPVYLPVPAGATGYAYTVSASGAIMGSVNLQRQDQLVVTKMTPDVEPPIAISPTRGEGTGRSPAASERHDVSEGTPRALPASAPTAAETANVDEEFASFLAITRSKGVGTVRK
jgi:hypothetical protein